MNSEDRELHATIGLSHIQGIGPMRYSLLVGYFGSSYNVYTASRQDLLQTGVGKNVVEKLIQYRNSDKLENAVNSIKSKHIEVLVKSDLHFPSQLKYYKDSPYILYALGNTGLLIKKLHIAIVGTRKPTPYGISVTKQFAYELSRSGISIVSGMAMGIDGVAHTSALDASGSTIAVLGSGVDICYPAVNRFLYKHIIEQGLILSEFPPGMQSSKGHFPARNRIVAGLSNGILVVEGRRNSGSLITAELASEYGKDVFAIPGPITSSQSEASVYLMQNGAYPVAQASDILSFYEKTVEKKISIKEIKDTVTKTQWLLLSLLDEHGQLHIDDLFRITKINSSTLSTEITTLELKGYIEEVGSKIYALRR